MTPDLDAFTHRRLARSYGTEALVIFADGKANRGKNFGHGLYEVEVKWLMEKEWAKTCDDVLWRRSKLGLFFNEQEVDTLSSYMQSQKRPNNVYSRLALRILSAML